MRVPKRITMRMLERMHACDAGLSIFRRIFGESAAFTPDNLHKFKKESGYGFEWLLSCISMDEWKRINNACQANRGCPCTCNARCATVLLRLARQNVPKKKGSAA